MYISEDPSRDKYKYCHYVCFQTLITSWEQMVLCSSSFISVPFLVTRLLLVLLTGQVSCFQLLLYIWCREGTLSMNLLYHLDRSPVILLSFCIQGKKMYFLGNKINSFHWYFPSNPLSHYNALRPTAKTWPFHQAYAFSPLTPILGSLFGDILTCSLDYNPYSIIIIISSILKPFLFYLLFHRNLHMSPLPFDMSTQQVSNLIDPNLSNALHVTILFCAILLP